MDASNLSPLSSFKSKKILRSPAPSDRKVCNPRPDALTVKTPGKPAAPPRRLRNRAVAMSIGEVRRAALKLRERGSHPAPRTEPVLQPQEEEIAKPKKPASAEIELPEKYELLEKFFNSLDSSIRLLQLKRSATTFTNISSQIESLTDRRFTHSHLAQLKFIMPEAIVLEKYLQHDERTSCMRPDLRIKLDVEAIKSKSKSKSHSGNLLLRKVFRNRLVDFFKSHPESDEVPEEELPGPFSRSKENNMIANSTQPSPTTSTSEMLGVAFSAPPVRASLVPPTFKRSFSQRASVHQPEKLKQDQSLIPLHSPVNSECKFARISEKASEISRGSSNEPCSSYEASPASKMLSTLPETPVKSIINDEDQCPDGIASLLKTPLGMASTPVKLMSATPAIHPSKRSYMSPDKSSSSPPTKLVRRPPPNRPLKFDTPVKSSSTRDGIFDILPQSLIQSIQEKERVALMEQDPAISQAIRRRKMVACLPKLFDRVHFFFQSIRRSVITKQELVQKLISQLDVVDKFEVEEQLRLLQELAPEWIHEKSSLSGDLLLCVNKISNPEALRTRLSEAI